MHPGPGKSIHNLRPWWERLDVSLHWPGKKQRTVFPASELLKTGKYTVTVKLNGKKHSTYTYRAKGGKIPFVGRQERGKAKPLEYLEGGRDRFYIERK